MRGGTSKGLFFHEHHLPADKDLRDRIILKAYGSPDPDRRQINGLGGATSTTSKVAIIGPSSDADYDVNYLFGQVSIDKPFVRYKGNCGNISSAVGPFAVEEGLIPAQAPVTRVRIKQVNTGKLIVADVPVKDNSYDEEGDFTLDGVPGSGSRITLSFMNPGGSVTNLLLPSGNTRDLLRLNTGESVEVSIVDAGNPVVFVRAKDLRLRGTEISEIDQDALLRQKMEAIRAHAAVLIGLAGSPEQAGEELQEVPKIAVVSEPCGYQALSGRAVPEKDIDLVARIMSMGTLHKAYAVTGAICTAGAAKIKGTVVHDIVRKSPEPMEAIRLGHPGGIISIQACVENVGDDYDYREARVYRTARRLMDGTVYVPKKYFSE